MNARPQLFGVSLSHEKKIVCAIQSFLEWGIWMGRTPRRSRKAGQTGCVLMRLPYIAPTWRFLWKHSMLRSPLKFSDELVARHRDEVLNQIKLGRVIYPFVDPDFHLTKSIGQTVRHLWKHRDDPEIVAAIMIAGSIFLRTGGRRGGRLPKAGLTISALKPRKHWLMRGGTETSMALAGCT
jgi:hypothetical protein